MNLRSIFPHSSSIVCAKLVHVERLRNLNLLNVSGLKISVLLNQLVLDPESCGVLWHRYHVFKCQLHILRLTWKKRGSSRKLQIAPVKRSVVFTSSVFSSISSSWLCWLAVSTASTRPPSSPRKHRWTTLR